MSATVGIDSINERWDSADVFVAANFRKLYASERPQYKHAIFVSQAVDSLIRKLVITWSEPCQNIGLSFTKDNWGVIKDALRRHGISEYSKPKPDHQIRDCEQIWITDSKCVSSEELKGVVASVIKDSVFEMDWAQKIQDWIKTNDRIKVAIQPNS
jgi:hypothetical protein